MIDDSKHFKEFKKRLETAKDLHVYILDDDRERKVMIRLPMNKEPIMKELKEFETFDWVEELRQSYNVLDYNIVVDLGDKSHVVKGDNPS